MKYVSKYSKIVTLEDHTTKGGCGSAINEYLSTKKIALPILNLGLDDAFPEHGSRNEILKLNGLDVDSIKKQISNFLKESQPSFSKLTFLPSLSITKMFSSSVILPIKRSR